MAEERGRAAYRSNSNGLSSYYRERFGSHSPEEYLNLRISGFDERLDREEIKAKLTHEFRKYAPFEIKVVKNPEEDERLAYVNFERNECARKVRYNMMVQLKNVLGKRVQCDPAGILRDQEGKYIPDRFNRAQQGDRRDGGGSGATNNNRNRPTKEPSTWRLKQDDDDATRTLFVGNMPSDVKEREIRHVFETYGKVEEVDIKTPINTDAAYAFVMFQTVDQAIEAKRVEQDRSLRPNGSRMKIGYGKSQVSRKVFVGGLGSWCDKEILQKAFSVHGFIDSIEYDNGDPYAYIYFDSTHSAQEAIRNLRGHSLPGSSRSIMVDYAKDSTTQPDKPQFRKRRASKSPVGANGPRTPPGSPKDVVRSYEELDATYAASWSGKMTLKKTDYPVKFYRIYGAERLVLKLLRDDDDAPLRLMITQRLSLMSQNTLEISIDGEEIPMNQNRKRDLSRLIDSGDVQECLPKKKIRDDTKRAFTFYQYPDGSSFELIKCVTCLELLSYKSGGQHGRHKKQLCSKTFMNNNVAIYVKDLQKSIARYCLSSGSSFRSTESKPFRRMIRECITSVYPSFRQENLQLPGRTAIRTTVIELCEEVIKEIGDKIKTHVAAGNATLVLDFGLHLHNYLSGFISVSDQNTINEEPNLLILPFCFSAMFEMKSAENIRDKLIEAGEKFNLLPDEVLNLNVVTDGAANISSMAK
uniref:Uncharacterized protein n=1 Tax=Caenorhabditis japonica TaxID=281687 RepID=A0A8R1HRL3_CAEJA